MNFKTLIFICAFIAYTYALTLKQFNYQMICLVNKERAKKKLPYLAYSKYENLRIFIKIFKKKFKKKKRFFFWKIYIYLEYYYCVWINFRTLKILYSLCVNNK